MTNEDRIDQRRTRRQLFQDCGVGVGKIALMSLLGKEALAGQRHFPQKIDHVIYLFMDTFAKETPKLLGTKRAFKQHGNSGVWISELLPHMAEVADQIAVING